MVNEFVDTLRSFFDNKISLQEWIFHAQKLLGPEGFLGLKNLLYQNNVSPAFLENLLLHEQHSAKDHLLPEAMHCARVHRESKRIKRPKKNKRKDVDYVEREHKARRRNSPQYWTAEESNKLVQLVNKHPNAGWVHIAKLLGTGKTGAQCSQRWSRVIAPSLTKKPWTAEEEERLIELHQMFGKMWANIASHLPGRSDIQCRYRYLKIMESQNAAWTLAEDIALLEEVTKQPEGAKDWQKVSEALMSHFGNSKKTGFRWPINCKRRYFELLKQNEQPHTSVQSQLPPNAGVLYTDEILAGVDTSRCRCLLT